MNLPLARLGVHIVSTLGVTKVVGDVIRSNSIANTTADVLRLRVGEVVISSMILSHAKVYLDEQIDNAVSWYENRNQDQTDLKVAD